MYQYPIRLAPEWEKSCDSVWHYLLFSGCQRQSLIVLISVGRFLPGKNNP